MLKESRIPPGWKGKEWLGVGRGKRKDRQAFNMVTEGPNWSHRWNKQHETRKESETSAHFLQQVITTLVLLEGRKIV